MITTDPKLCIYCKLPLKDGTKQIIVKGEHTGDFHLACYGNPKYKEKKPKKEKKKVKCSFCGKLIDLKTEFVDSLSLKEYRISGFCQKCQNKVFGEPKWTHKK